MTEPKICAPDSMASEYDSWYEDKGKLIFNIETSGNECQGIPQVLPLLAGFVVTVAGKAKQRSNIEKGEDGKCLP